MANTEYQTLDEMLDDMMKESTDTDELLDDIIEEACAKKGGKGCAEEACKTGGKGCAEEACKTGGKGCAEEACKTGGKGCAEEACKTGGKGCAEEACNRGGKGCATNEASDPPTDGPMYTDSDTRSEIALEGDCEGKGKKCDREDDDEDEDDDDMEDLEDLEDDDEDDDDEEDEDMDIADMTDEELQDLAKDLEDLDDFGDEEEGRLTPDEEIRADDEMAIVGASSLIRSEMNAEERAQFLESAEDLRIAMSEGFVNEPMIQVIREFVEPIADNILTEAKTYNKTTVRFSKQARLAQLHSLAVLVSARAHNDPNFVKYKKACKLKKIYKMKMDQKWDTEATKRMRVMFARMKSSKSPAIKNLVNKIKPGK